LKLVVILAQQTLASFAGGLKLASNAEDDPFDKTAPSR
jgi:hypothetical protein